MGDAPKIAVYGAGGIGAYFGGRLAQGGADVHLVARGPHLDALRRDGLWVESIHGDFHVDLPATDDPTDIGPCDYVLVCVKSYDTESVAAALGPLLDEDTAVISLQNGVDNEALLADAVGAERVLGGVCYIFSTIGEPGTVQHTDGAARIIFGELDGRQTARADRFLTACEAGDIDVERADDVEVAIWEKFTLICAVAGTTAAIRLPLGEIRAVEESWDLFQSMLREVVDVAQAEGVALPDETVEQWTSFTRDLDPDSYSSLHYDLTHGKRMELDALHGSVVRRASERDVEVPATRCVYAMLKPWAERNAQT